MNVWNIRLNNIIVNGLVIEVTIMYNLNFL